MADPQAPGDPGLSEHRELTGRRGQPRPATALMGIALVIAIVAGAWYLGGRQDPSGLNRGGSVAPLLPRGGDAAPDLTALGADGRPIRRSDLRGQPVWLNFWGSWCPPCRSELPSLQAAYRRLQVQGLVLLAVSLDESLDEAVRYAERHGATYTVAADPYRDGTAAYPIANFPTHILIDRNGIVRDVVLAELDEDAVIARAEAILPRTDGA